MIFNSENSVFRVAHISGPTHNFLAIKLLPCEPNCIIIEAKPFKGEVFNSLDSEAIKKYVLAGVEKATSKWKIKPHVASIQYIQSDTPPESKYEFLAEAIIERFQNEILLQVGSVSRPVSGE